MECPRCKKHFEVKELCGKCIFYHEFEGVPYDEGLTHDRIERIRARLCEVKNKELNG